MVLETDYLVIGSGAVGLAFVDAMLDQSTADFIIVDRNSMPGGHWNDAYPFVRLHQPSAFYGVESELLGHNQIDISGSNKGFYELASGPEVLAYFDRIMRQRLLPSGRVRYFPMCEYKGENRFDNCLSGKSHRVTVRKRLVDATFFDTIVPSTHQRGFSVGDDVVCIAPNELPKCAPSFSHYSILGGGKTAMDAAVWLIEHGTPPEHISWVCPRDSWLINRATTQPGKAFFTQTGSSIARQLQAMAKASSVDDLFDRLEAAGIMLRVDPAIRPSMFHYATISQGEVDCLRQISQIIRGERVQALQRGGIHMCSGLSTQMPEDTLYIDCTARAVGFTAEREQAVFEPGKITLQPVFAPLVTYSAAIIARVEAVLEDDMARNKACTPVRLADTPYEWMGSALGNMTNQALWSQLPELKKWINTCRLNPAAQAISEGAFESAEGQAVFRQIKENSIPAVMNIHKLIAEGAPE